MNQEGDRGSHISEIRQDPEDLGSFVVEFGSPVKTMRFRIEGDYQPPEIIDHTEGLEPLSSNYSPPPVGTGPGRTGE